MINCNTIIQRVPNSEDIKAPEAVSMKNEVNNEVKNKEKNEEEKKEEPSKKEIIEAVETANKKMGLNNKNLHFSVHEKTNRIMIQIIETESKEVIREIPPKKMLDMLANILESAGLIIDEKR